MSTRLRASTESAPTSRAEMATTYDPDPRQDSLRSSRLGSFIDKEPTFDASVPGSSETGSDLEGVEPERPVIAVVWRDLVVVGLMVLRSACETCAQRLGP